MVQLPWVLEEIDRLFHELVHRPWGSAGTTLAPAELHEVEDGWVIDLPAAGMRAQDLTVSIKGTQLTVSGKRHSEEKHGDARRGWSVAQHETAFSRTITLPQAARPDDFEARLEGSVLKIHVRRRTP